MTGLAPTTTSRSRNELKFEFEAFEVNLQDTILIPTKANRDTLLEDMDIVDFGFVRYSDLFQLGYAGLRSMRFLQTWNDDNMHLENWPFEYKVERLTMEDIYTILAEIDVVMGKARMTRDEHAQAMTNMTKMRDFVAFVADQERKVADDQEAKGEITAGKEELGIKNK